MLLIVAALLIWVPLGTLPLIVTVMVNVSELPLGKVETVSVMMLPLLWRLNASVPPVWFCNTKVSLPGT